jgi:conjugative transposon TraN protein
MMRKICAVWISLVILSFTGGRSMAQSTREDMVQGTIASLRLPITYDKTTNLLFPYPIKSVNKGSKDVLVQIASGVENILLVKAAKQGFAETNLTVVTADGKLYSYLLNYTDTPAELNFKIGFNINYPKADALFTYKGDNEAKVYDITEQIATRKPVIKNIKDNRFDIGINLNGVYIKDDKLYFQFALENNSNVDYNIDAIRFYIRDKKKSKRTASQEIELEPVRSAGNTEIIKGQSQQNFVIAFSKFTIPDGKLLAIQLMEENGGRHLQLKIQNKTIVGAIPIK